MIGNSNDSKRITKCQYQRHLDDLGFPEGECPIRIAKKRNQFYGQWLMRTNQAKFDEGYLAWEAREKMRRGYV